jgi:hypothetical protein
MNLINLELGKWLYLIIYLFFPVITLLYLIRTFGLEAKEDTADSIQRHIEQADYWANVALQMMQSQVGTKSLDSLIYTVQHNLDAAAGLTETAVLTQDQHQTLTTAYGNVADKLALISGRTTGGLRHHKTMTSISRT